MTIELGFNLLKDAVIGWIPFNITWALPAILTLLTLALLTREITKWKTLALPVLIGWHISGVTPHYLMYVIASVIFTLEHISIEQISQIAEAATRGAKTAINQEYWKPRQDKTSMTRMANLDKERKEYIKSQKTTQERQTEADKETLKRLKREEELRRLRERQRLALMRGNRAKAEKAQAKMQTIRVEEQ